MPAGVREIARGTDLVCPVPDDRAPVGTLAPDGRPPWPSRRSTLARGPLPLLEHGPWPEPAAEPEPTVGPGPAATHDSTTAPEPDVATASATEPDGLDRAPDPGPSSAQDAAAGATAARPRVSRVLSPLIALLAVAGVAVAAASTGPPAGGPVDVGRPSGVVIRSFPGGSTITFGVSALASTSDTDAIELVSVEPLLGRPAPDVAGAATLDTVTPPGPVGSFDVRAGLPQAGHEAVAGHTVPAGSSEAVRIALPLVVPEEGAAVLDGFAITYRVGERLYREQSSTMLVLCPAEAPQECLALEARL